MEYILLNCVLALLDYPGATLLGINRLLVDKEYRQRVIEKIRDPIVKTFWVAEFSSWSEKYATEAIAPVQNKVGQFLSASIIRNIVAQVKSSIVPRRIMDEQKIFIVNLSKGRIGEDNMRLLGGMLITKIQLAAMERVDVPEEQRKDFMCYVDEFQNFANPSFASILSEARKYRLSLTLAHQYIEQLDETVRDAVFGNVGTMVMMRVGAPDAAFLETEFTPTFLPEDLTNLPKYHVYLKLMVDGVATEPFSATTLPPIANRTGSEEKVIAVSRERYAEHRDVIEDKVLKWSGMETGGMSVDVEPAGPVTAFEPPAGVQYPVIKTEEEKEQERREGTDDEKAGEYLRFSPERLAAISKAAPAQKKDKPKFKHSCSRCGKVWEMPIQLDPTRPMYCSDCLPLVRDEKKVKGKVMKAAVTGTAPEGLELEEVLSESDEKTETPGSRIEQAMRDVEEGHSISFAKKKPLESNRPRIVVTNSEVYSNVFEEHRGEEERSELLDAIAERRGAPIDARKQVAVPPRVSRTEPSHRPDGGEGRRDDRGDRRRRPRGPRERTEGGRQAQGQGRREEMGNREPLLSERREPSLAPQRQEQTVAQSNRVKEDGAPPHREDRRDSRDERPLRSVDDRRTLSAPPVPAAPARLSSEQEATDRVDDGTIGDAPRVAFKASSSRGPDAAGTARRVQPGQRITF